MRVQANSKVSIRNGTEKFCISPDTNNRWVVGMPITFASGRRAFATGVCVKVSRIIIDYTAQRTYVNGVELTQLATGEIAHGVGLFCSENLYKHFAAAQKAGKYPYQVAGTFRGKLIEWQLNPMP